MSRDLSGCGCGDEEPVSIHWAFAAQIRNLTGRGTTRSRGLFAWMLQQTL